MKMGLSLSVCIRDIADGKVDIKDVHHIITGCSPRNEADIQEDILPTYQKIYWRKCPERALEIFNQLRSERKISWLSDFEKRPLLTGMTFWLDWPD